MNKQNQMPPVIRVFLSSTFSDMERERTYFNEELSPRLSRICAERGVSFFSVDLRWGITQEDQINGQVLPICLGEIDKCRPYFIGILGSRYGSVMETVPEHLGQSIPWLQGREGRSITELEMLYAVLEHPEAARNSGFYFRSEELSRQWYGDTQEDARLTRLKRRIREQPGISGSDYDSLEAFGERVMADILGWLDREFPEPEQVAQVRRNWYNGELLRGYLPVPEHSSFLNAYLRDSRRSLLFYGDGSRGKTTFLTAWEPERGHKLLLNCGSDDAFTYWPELLRQVVDGIHAIDGGSDIMAGTEMTLLLMRGVHGKEFYFTSSSDVEKLRLGFLQWLSKRTSPEPVYVVINDLNLISDESGQMLSWLPAKAVGNVQFICSTNLQEMVDNAEALNWNCRELPAFPRAFAGEFLHNYLSIYGKGLSPQQSELLLSSAGAAYPGQLRVMADFLIDHGRFHNLEELIGGLAKTDNPYGYIYRYFVTRNPRREVLLLCVLGLLRCARMSLQEGVCYRLVSQLTEVTAMEWAAARGEFEQFGVIHGDSWTLRQKELGSFVDSLLNGSERQECHRVLGEYMLSQVAEEASDYMKGVCAGEALYHLAQAGEEETLLAALQNPQVLTLMATHDWRSVRVAWMWLVLNTDIDVVGQMQRLLERQGSDGSNLAEVLTTLPVDLSIVPVATQLYRAGHRLRSLLGPNLNQISREFAKLHQRLQEMRANREYREVIAYARQAMDSGMAQNGIERCRLLFFQADCQMILRLYPELMQTANEYYLESLRCGSLADMYRAIMMREEALEGLQKLREALVEAARLERMSLREGDMRGYIGVLHSRSVCLYQSDAFDEAMECLELQERILKKLGDEKTLADVVVTKCNVLSARGDDEGALALAQKVMEETPDTPENSRFRCILMGNMGAYALELERFFPAEQYLLEAARSAEVLKMESVLFRARQGLIKIYERTDRFMAATELYEKLLELHWSRGEYQRVLKLLNSATELLFANKYGPAARELRKRWEERFATIPGGEEMLKWGVDSSVADGQKIDTLEEKLTMAKSEGDPLKIAMAYEELMRAVGSRDVNRATVCAEQAVFFYRQANREEMALLCQETILPLHFDSGHIRNEEWYRRVVALITDPALLQITQIWQMVGTIANQEDSPTNEQQAAVAAATRKLTALAPQRPLAVALCAVDVLPTVVQWASGEEILALATTLRENGQEPFLGNLERTMMKTSQKDIHELTKDYASPVAEERLAYYEKCISVMDALQMRNIAGTAGNVALIFRRRRDKKKTLRYHEISRKHYKAQGLVRDQLIEEMNLATAYKEFGDHDRAVEILRQSLKEGVAASERGMAAAIAGNLAAYLTERQNPNDREEIIRCFTLEEFYFRNSGAQRELAISLQNQIRYHMATGTRKDWEDKLRELGQIVRKNNFREFEQNLARMEWLAQRESAPRMAGEEEAKALMERVLADRNAFRLQTIRREEGMFHAECYPCKENPAGLEMLHLYLQPESGNQLVAVFLFQPRMKAEGTVEAINAYVNWWNSLDKYNLIFHEDQLVLQANCRIMAPDEANLISRFGKYLDLWQADALAAGMISVGMQDLSVFQGLKLQILTEGQ